MTSSWDGMPCDSGGLALRQRVHEGVEHLELDLCLACGVEAGGVVAEQERRPQHRMALGERRALDGVGDGPQLDNDRGGGATSPCKKARRSRDIGSLRNVRSDETPSGTGKSPISSSTTVFAASMRKPSVRVDETRSRKSRRWATVMALALASSPTRTPTPRPVRSRESAQRAPRSVPRRCQAYHPYLDSVV